MADEDLICKPKNIVVHQIGRIDLGCPLDDPLAQRVIPQHVRVAVEVAFGSGSTVDLVTITWNGGSSATFRKRDPNENLMSGEEVFVNNPRGILSPEEQQKYLDYVAQSLKEQ